MDHWHFHWSSVGRFSSKDFCEEQIDEACAVCAFVSRYGFCCQSAPTDSWTSAWFPIENETWCRSLWNLAGACKDHHAILTCMVLGVRPAAVSICDYCWTTAKTRRWKGDAALGCWLDIGQCIVDSLEILHCCFLATVRKWRYRRHVRSTLTSEPLKAASDAAHLLPFLWREFLVWILQTTFLDSSFDQIFHKGFLSHFQGPFVVFVTDAANLLASVDSRIVLVNLCHGAPTKHLFEKTQVEGLAVDNEEIVYVDDRHCIQYCPPPSKCWKKQRSKECSTNPDSNILSLTLLYHTLGAFASP